MNILLIIISMFFSPPKSVYDFKIKTIDGKQISLSKYKGKKILIVNTASKCGFTPQYKELEKLHEQYGKDVVLIGFPAGNFGGQELTSNAEIKEFCEANFGVSFLLSEKVSVKGGDMDPLFQYLTTQDNPDFKGDINWNFEKFLIDENGILVHRFRSKTTPLSPEITKHL